MQACPQPFGGRKADARLSGLPLVVALLLAVLSCGGSPTAPGDGGSGAPIAPTTIYVSPVGRDQNDGSMAAPLQTIREGVRRLRPGDTLFIRGGTYTGAENTIDSQAGQVPAGRSRSEPVTIAGYPGETVILRPPFNVAGIRLTTENHAYMVFRDFTIDMTNSGTGSDADGVYLFRAHHNRFQRLDVMNSHNNGVHFAVQTPFNEVIECRIHDNGYVGGPTANGHGLYVTGSDNVIQNSEIYNNQGYGVHIYNNAGSRADPSRNVARGNRIHGNGGSGRTAYGVVVAWGNANDVDGNQIYGNLGGIQVYTESTNTDVRNNTVHDNRPLEGIVIQYASGARVRNNRVYSNATDIVDLGTGTVLSENAVGGGPGLRGVR